MMTAFEEDPCEEVTELNVYDKRKKVLGACTEGPPCEEEVRE